LEMKRHNRSHWVKFEKSVHFGPPSADNDLYFD
jgi:hypothetical protein